MRVWVLDCRGTATIHRKLSEVAAAVRDRHAPFESAIFDATVEETTHSQARIVVRFGMGRSEDAFVAGSNPRGEELRALTEEQRAELQNDLNGVFKAEVVA
jgi:hypothetical protein